MHEQEVSPVGKVQLKVTVCVDRIQLSSETASSQQDRSARRQLALSNLDKVCIRPPAGVAAPSQQFPGEKTRCGVAQLIRPSRPVSARARVRQSEILHVAENVECGSRGC